MKLLTAITVALVATGAGAIAAAAQTAGLAGANVLAATPRSTPVVKIAAKCVRAGGSADMITRDLSEFMAKAALKNSIAGMGKKPVGPITLTCDKNFPVHCLARQKAC